jgi:ribosomal protein uS19
LTQLVHARVRRRFQRGLKRRAATLLTKLRKAKTEAPPNEKPAAVKTHLRDMLVIPEMIGSVIGIYNGKIFNTVEIKPEMTGHYLGEFSISYVFLFPLIMADGETCKARSTWYWRHPFITVYSIEGTPDHKMQC